MKRDMAAGRRKAEEQGCRLCASRFAVEAAHILPRSRIMAGPPEDPDEADAQLAEALKKGE